MYIISGMVYKVRIGMNYVKISGLCYTDLERTETLLKILHLCVR
jgi:hypothetical protein